MERLWTGLRTGISILKTRLNRQITTNYAVGDSVEVTGGYLEGFVGVVDAIDTEKQLTRVTVSMMGKDVTVELALNEVKPLE